MAKNSWNIDMIGNQKAKVAVVTGSTSGIGLETARVLAHKEATVIMAVRNLPKGQSAADQIIDESRNKDVRPMELDLADLASIRRFTETFKEQYSRLDMLINNAGVMVPPFTQTRDGFELQRNTPLTSALNFFFAQKIAMGALPTLYAATAPNVKGGDYYGPDGFAEMKGYPKHVTSIPLSHNAEIGQRLWQASERLTGVKF